MHKVDLITDNLNYLCTPRKIPFINVNDVTLQRTEKKKKEKKKRKKAHALMERRLWALAEMLGPKCRTRAVRALSPAFLLLLLSWRNLPIEQQAVARCWRGRVMH